MPISGGGTLKDHRHQDEQQTLLAGDEERGLLSNRGKMNGNVTTAHNGDRTPDNVSRKNYKYGAVWHRAAQAAIRNRHRLQISERLQSFDTSQFDDFHMSKENLDAIKSKKVKRFYVEQNQRLEDWFEVDAVVTALAEDVLRSFEPQGGWQFDHGRSH